MSRGTTPLPLGGEPRVDLMPAEVRVKRRGRGIRRLLALALLLSVLVAAAGVAWANLRAVTATVELQNAQARTTELLTEQLQYAEVTGVRSLMEQLERERAAVTATEVLWKPYLDGVLAVLPEEARIVSIQARFPSYGEPDLGVTGPLRQARAAELIIVVHTETIPQVTQWLRALAGTPAFADEMPTVVEADDGGYLTSLTLNARPDALAERFGPAPQPVPEGESTEPEVQQ